MTISELQVACEYTLNNWMMPILGLCKHPEKLDNTYYVNYNRLFGDVYQFV